MEFKCLCVSSSEVTDRQTDSTSCCFTGTIKLNATENIYKTRATAGLLNAVDGHTLVKYILTKGSYFADMLPTEISPRAMCRHHNVPRTEQF